MLSVNDAPKTTDYVGFAFNAGEKIYLHGMTFSGLEFVEKADPSFEALVAAKHDFVDLSKVQAMISPEEDGLDGANDSNLDYEDEAELAQY